MMDDVEESHARRRWRLTMVALLVVMTMRQAVYDAQGASLGLHSERLCVSGVPKTTRVCAHMGLLDHMDRSKETTNRETLLALKDGGVSCHDVDVFWDVGGNFYVGHPQAIVTKYNLSSASVLFDSPLSKLQTIAAEHRQPAPSPTSAPPAATAATTKTTPGTASASASRSTLATATPGSDQGGDTQFAMPLEELFDLMITHKLGPISLQLKGQERPDYIEQLGLLHRMVAMLPKLGGRSGKICLLVSSVESVVRVEAVLQYAQHTAIATSNSVLFGLILGDRPPEPAVIEGVKATGLSGKELAVLQWGDNQPYVAVGDVPLGERNKVDLLFPSQLLWGETTDFAEQAKVRRLHTHPTHTRARAHTRTHTQSTCRTSKWLKTRCMHRDTHMNTHACRNGGNRRVRG